MSWDKLSMALKAEIIKLGVSNGITDLSSIKLLYNNLLLQHPYNAQNTVEALYASTVREDFGKEPNRNYTISEEMADSLGYYIDNRGHRDDGVKLEAHPTHPSRGIWNGDYYNLTEKGLNDSNYTLFGMFDGRLDPQAVLTYNDSLVLPEITVTPLGNYYYNTYDNIKLYSEGGPTKPKMKRVRDNDSPTQKGSEYLENDILFRQKSMYLTAVKKGHDSTPYYIPYIQEKEIKIPGIGRVSSNMLDSLAINAERANIPISEGIGLAAQETLLGAAPTISLQGLINKYKENNNGNPPSSEWVSKRNREMLNMSFARNHGGIHPLFLVNDHEWYKRGWEESAKYRKLGLKDIKSPLVHAFTLYKNNLYNPGDATHTTSVKKAAGKIKDTKEYKNWYKQYLDLRKKGIIKKAFGGNINLFNTGGNKNNVELSNREEFYDTMPYRRILLRPSAGIVVPNLPTIKLPIEDIIANIKVINDSTLNNNNLIHLRFNERPLPKIIVKKMFNRFDGITEDTLLLLTIKG